MQRQAAVIVLDEVPDSDTVSELASKHLEEFPAEAAFATCEIVYEVPQWLDVHDQDQMGAFLRDGAACLLVVYMEEEDEDADDLEDDEDFLD